MSGASGFEVFPVLTESPMTPETEDILCDFSLLGKATTQVSSPTLPVGSFVRDFKSRLHSKLHGLQAIIVDEFGRETLSYIMDSPYEACIFDWYQSCFSEQLLRNVSRDIDLALALMQMEKPTLSMSEPLEIDYDDMNLKARSVKAAGVNWDSMPSPRRTLAEAFSFQYEPVGSETGDK